MSYKCICNNGATIGHIHGCQNTAGCTQCCKGKGGINTIRSGMIVRGNNGSKKPRYQKFRNVSGEGVVKAGLQGGIIAGALVVGVLLYAMVRVSQSK